MIRLSQIRSGALATAATLALAACANQTGMTPSSLTAHDETQISPALTTTCATSPPQYEWIFKGACDEFRVKPSGAYYTLFGYEGISVKGLMGANDLKSSVKMAIADALDQNGDIENYKSMAFPAYKAEGTTYVYLAMTDQSTRAIEPVLVKGKPFFRWMITNAEGFGSYTKCSFGLLTFPRGKSPRWIATPFEGTIKGTTVRISVYFVPKGFDFPPKAPIYLAFNCFK